VAEVDGAERNARRVPVTKALLVEIGSCAGTLSDGVSALAAYVTPLSSPHSAHFLSVIGVMMTPF